MQTADSHPGPSSANGPPTHPDSNPTNAALLESPSKSENPVNPSPLKTPFPYPTEESKTPPPRTLTLEQSTKYATVLQTVESWTSDPPPSSPKGLALPLTDAERMWLTRECLLRYLRATKWSVKDTVARLIATLAWRREYILESHTAEYFSPENATGKQVIMGYDFAARPCLYLSPKQQNTPRGEKQIQHLVFSLEQLIDLMPPGQEMLTLLINFKEATQGPSGGQGRQVLKILQSHYPERLGKALLINVPWLFWSFFKMISPFIDPNTREKVSFDEDLRQFVPPEQLLKSFGGDVDFEYDHAVYWPALNALATQRRQEEVERWVKGGKKVGECEGYLKGGDVKGLSGEQGNGA